MRKNITILGSSGSIGRNTLNVIKNFPSKFTVKALCVNNNIDVLERQIKEFRPEIVAVYNEKKAKELIRRGLNVKVLSGIEGIVEIATLEAVDFVMVAISGSIGLIPTIAAIKAKKTIGLANKEVLVAGGELVMKLSSLNKSSIIPVDSEHNAIFQCLRGDRGNGIRRLILTASGGPFFRFSKDRLKNVGIKDALLHPTYSMGKKISIDSSTLMNKGLEVIEAFWLFNVPYHKIDVVIHPKSLVHGFVEFVDGSLLAQISEPNMELPISYALNYPLREKRKSSLFDFNKFSKFEFFKPDFEKFRCLYLAYEALKVGKSMPCYLNAANEVLVERFLKGKISWMEISKKLEKLISSHRAENMLDLEAILEIDKKARMEAEKI
jgi:1-deoxy-D-xylulose-5-phosphate reductoisomerase